MYGCIRLLFCLQYYRRKEIEIYLKEKISDIFDQFISMTEHEIDSIQKHGVSCLVSGDALFCLNCVYSIFQEFINVSNFATTIGE